MKKVLFVLIILILLALTACQEVGEAKLFAMTESAPEGRRPRPPSLPTIIECKETDEGIDQYTYGEAKWIFSDGKEGWGIDNCRNEEVLREMHCDGLEPKQVEIYCTYGCESGACRRPPQCFDSDIGKTYDKKGTITVTYPDGRKRVETDSCNPDGTLREWFCGRIGDPAGLLRSENYVKCEHGCKDGACISLQPPATQKVALVAVHDTASASAAAAAHTARSHIEMLLGRGVVDVKIFQEVDPTKLKEWPLVVLVNGQGPSTNPALVALIYVDDEAQTKIVTAAAAAKSAMGIPNTQMMIHPEMTLKTLGDVYTP